MFLDDENATNVPENAPAPEPAKTAENASAGGEPGAAAASSSAAADETGVSPASWHDALEHMRGVAAAELSAHLPAIEELIGKAQEQTEVKIKQWVEDTKAELLSRFTAIANAVGKMAPTGTSTNVTVSTGSAAELKVGDPVKVWADPEHKAFRTGEIQAIHDGGHAYDVTLDDGTVTKIGADGLEYDDR